jgi:hypothetical protein
VSPAGLETEEIPESEWSTTRIGDWKVVWSARFELKKFRDARSKLKGEVIVCDVEEHVMYASVAAFKDGNLSWRIVHDAQKASDHLLLEGAPPQSLLQPLSSPLVHKWRNQAISHFALFSFRQHNADN